MNDIHGLGMTKESSSLKIFLDVLILLTMPDRCKRNEVVYLNIDVFSYLKNNQSVALSFQRSDGEFEVLKAAYDGWIDGKQNKPTEFMTDSKKIRVSTNLKLVSSEKYSSHSKIFNNLKFSKACKN